jgi:hypothetical protein
MNDPRITAYALNELHGAAREKFESDLAADIRTQTDLHNASDVVGALGQIIAEPADGLEPSARENLLRAIADNQRAFRQRRKIVRFAVPVSLAAAASIAVLLWVTGDKTTPGPAVAAADGLPAGEPATEIAASGVEGVDASFAASVGRTITLSESARAALEMRLDKDISMAAPPIRVKPFVWDEQMQRLGSSGQEQP